MSQSKPFTTQIAIKSIRIDGGTQSRASISQETWEDYALLMMGSKDEPPAAFPPMDVFLDPEGNYWLADGFHRYYAQQHIKVKTVTVNVHKGTKRDAILFSVSANLKAPLRPTRKDKQFAVDLLLRDPEWRKWSNSEIARRCGVTAPTVAAHKAKLIQEEKARNTPVPTSSGNKSTQQGEEIQSPKNSLGENCTVKYTDRHGNVSEMDTSNMGRPPAQSEDEDDILEVDEDDEGDLEEDLEDVETCETEDETKQTLRRLRKTAKWLWRYADDVSKVRGKEFHPQSFVCQVKKLYRFCKMLGLAPSRVLKDPKYRPKPL